MYLYLSITKKNDYFYKNILLYRNFMTDIINIALESTVKVSLNKLKNDYDINDKNYNYILKQSLNLMPILFIQFKYDFVLISQNINKYQMLLIDELKIKKI